MKMKKKIIQLVNLIICAVILSAWAPIPKSFQKKLNVLGSFWNTQIIALDIKDTFSSDKEIFVRYEAIFKDSDQVKAFYAHARIDDDGLKEIENKNFFSRMKLMDGLTWQAKTRNLKSVKIFSSEQYNEIYANILKEDLSRDKMAEIIIKNVQQYMSALKIQDNKIIMVMDQDEQNTQSFLFVDIKEGLVVDLFIEDEKKEAATKDQLNNGIKSADQLIINSHLLGVTRQPLTSAFRLFSWTKDTALHTFQPQRLANLRLKDNTPLIAIDDSATKMDLVQWEKDLDKIVGDKKASGSMNFLIGGDEYFPRQIQAFEEAMKSIDVRIFIFDNDDFGVELANILKKKSKEGVKVRVLLDSMGVVMGEGKVSETLPQGFKSPDSMVKYLKKDSKIKVRVSPAAWFKADHTKTICIDNQVCFTGGMNFGREYRYDWHDLMMEVQGSIVDHIDNDFDMAWTHAGKMGDIAYLTKVISSKYNLASEQRNNIRPLYTAINTQQIYRSQLEAIKKSKKYIYISNAYFSDNSIIEELINARQRGVDVRIILPVHGNHEIMNKNNLIVANVFLKEDIKVYFYPGMSHIKAAIYDGWLCTGSANFDKLSFVDNLEFNLATSDPGVVNDIKERLFNADFKKSMPMTEELKIGLKERLAEFLANQL